MQRATSLEDQIRNCRQFAARMGGEVLDEHVYQDTAVSGFGVEDRPAYQRLVTAALAAVPPFTVILVDDLSRLSRDLVETLKVYRRLKRNGVRHAAALVQFLHLFFCQAERALLRRGLMLGVAGMTRGRRVDQHRGAAEHQQG